MGTVRYSMLVSLDGYAVDADGSFAFAAPDEEVHAAANDLAREVRTHLYGRRMYEVMQVWQTFGAGPVEPGEPPAPAPVRAFGDLWRAADKVVVSSTLDDVTTPRTDLVTGLDPDQVRSLAADGDVSVSGPTLAATAFALGLVDTVHLFVFPVSVGGGLPALPRDQRLDLALTGVERYGSGVVRLDHRVRR
ncbi:dihydrofolate reductase family protein [Luteimicrobium subarcticum]|uniref:Dihydrofolate reductase n=1 Tax=Luteimicrobium subarcticum TaxID=620910 RepID=A0A2M8W1M0_9MICO|nr:dihydrofolate reductase family protein [Luteimicrobium subarcticum]PJI84832.1 dihydrofolate reductase [Luteimicrobium subarcticum]